MLPDSFLGGLIMTLVNMIVVFLVLGFLALLIRGVHAAIARVQPEEPEMLPRAVLVVSSHSESEEGGMVLPDNIGPAKKAAILAAISMYLGKPETAMFVRNVKDSGAWGRQSRRQSYGQSGPYRSGQSSSGRQLFRNSRPSAGRPCK
jgi:Na+-transporting methylmalonyl-CoA/oxaloacetate decarboxylase gamma subunit